MEHHINYEAVAEELDIISRYLGLAKDTDDWELIDEIREDLMVLCIVFKLGDKVEESLEAFRITGSLDTSRLTAEERAERVRALQDPLGHPCDSHG